MHQGFLMLEYIKDSKEHNQELGIVSSIPNIHILQNAIRIVSEEQPNLQNNDIVRFDS